MILGTDFGLHQLHLPGHQLLYKIGHNGCHRATAIAAAGFPLALAKVTATGGPFQIPHDDGIAHARLLIRAGLLTPTLHESYGERTWRVHATAPGNSLLLALTTLLP